MNHFLWCNTQTQPIKKLTSKNSLTLCIYRNVSSCAITASTRTVTRVVCEPGCTEFSESNSFTRIDAQLVQMTVKRTERMMSIRIQ